MFTLRSLFALVVVLGLAFPLSARAASDLEIAFPQEHQVTEFTDSFGAPRAGHNHRGNDLMAPKMTKVFAIADGEVLWIRDRGTAGRYIAIQHAGGWESWYMHLNDDTPGTDDGSAPMELGVLVEVGERVEAGDHIGYVGDSGNAEGSSPHNHFELHRNGGAVDPYPYLVEALERARNAPLPAVDFKIRVR